MTAQYQGKALDICIEAIENKKFLKDMAQHIKHHYNREFPGSGKATEGVFHCVVGKHFGSKSFTKLFSY